MTDSLRSSAKLTPMQYRKLLMEKMLELNDDNYWISTNLLNEELGITETSPQRVGTNLNIMQRRGYVRRLDNLQLWKLTPRGKEVNIKTFKC